MKPKLRKGKEIRNALRKIKQHLKDVDRRGKKYQPNIVLLKEQKAALEADQKVLSILQNRVFSRFSGFINPGSGDIHITIPKIFSFCSNYSDCIRTIKVFASSIYEYLGGEITLDFSLCKEADTSALFVMQILRLEMLEAIDFLQKRLKAASVKIEIKVIMPKNTEVIRLLIATGYPFDIKDLKSVKDEARMAPVHSMGYYKGEASQKHYRENKKTVYCTHIVRYLNSCLGQHKYMLTQEDINNLEGIIAEVLSNAEDHSPSNTWFITANFSKDKATSDEDIVGELNLTIMNFGPSFYESFLETREDNFEVFNAVEGHLEKLRKNFPKAPFEDEELFTLIMMSDRISRLRFRENSRGTGTMKFLNSFVELGDFIDKKKGYVPNLSIFTGYTHLICDNQFKPFLKDNVFCLSLNHEEDLNIPPSATHLKKLKEKFPGTLLSVKIYLNKKHLDYKYGGNSHERN